MTEEEHRTAWIEASYEVLGWCPCYPHEVIDEKLRVIRERSHTGLGEAWQIPSSQ